MTTTTLGRNKAGFTLIELLAVLAIVSSVVVLLPAVQRIRDLSIQAQSANLPVIATDLGNFATAADRIVVDQGTLSSDALAAGDRGSLSQQNLQADLGALCGALQTSDTNAGTLLAAIKQRLGQQPLTAQQKTILLQAQATVAGWDQGVGKIAAVVGQVLAVGCSAGG